MGDGHGHDGHVHGRASDGSDRRLLVAALVLLVAFMAFEVGAAVFANSLALLADAGHMLVDIGAIACSLLALNLAARPETGSHTFGLKRAEILAAAANALALLVVAALVTFEAVGRLLHPEAVDGAVLIVVATVGVALHQAATQTI
jgi:cobalt-zinc-cadmium efflux system protein